MPMSINSLMKYIRKNKRINISGSTQKRKLRYMGYFHGYESLRKQIPVNVFNKILFTDTREKTVQLKNCIKS